MSKAKEKAQLPTHGASVLPSIEVRSYNLEIEDEDGFIGDRASRSKFWEILERSRKVLREVGDDPLGDKPAQEIGKKKLAALLAEGDPEAAGLVQTAVEEFAQELTRVIRRFLRLKEWRDIECIVIGGGFRASRMGELVIGRSAVLLKSDGASVDLKPVRGDPDEAGLMGAAHLLPAWMLKGYEGILAVDVGGTNLRAGLIELNLKKAGDLSKARVPKFDLWRHADEEKVSREDAVERLVKMLRKLIDRAEKDKMRLAPLIGIGCPGVIHEDGSIDRGAQNLPGNWESSRFNLPASLRREIPEIGEHETMVVMHNDAVVQGLSELPFMQEIRHWGVLTIGTGLGNASFVNRRNGK